MANRFWVGGSATWDATAGTKWSATSGGVGGASVPGTGDDCFLDSNDGAAGAAVITISGTVRVNNFSCTGGTGNFTGTLTGTASPILQVNGNITFASGMTLSVITLCWTYTNPGTLTSAGKIIPVFQMGSAAIGVTNTMTLQDDLSVGSITAGRSGLGTLDLNNKNVTISGSWSDGPVAAILLGTGTVEFTTGTGQVCALSAPITPSTCIFKFSYTGASQRNIANPSNRTYPSIWVSAGTGAFKFNQFNTTGSNSIINLDFTGFAGSWGQDLGDATLRIMGNLTLASGMTVASSTDAVVFGATSGTKTITTNGVTFDRSLTFNGVGGTWQLVDNLTSTSGKTATLTNGTLDLNGKTLTAGIFSTSNANTRVISSTSGPGTIAVNSTGTVWDSTTATGLTINSNVTIKLTNSSTTAKTFAGGGGTFYDVWNATANTGQLTISGSNTFHKLKSDAGRTINVTAATTQTLNDFPEISGQGAGNRVTLQSTIAATAWNISKATGIVVCDWLSLKDSAAAGGALFYANQTTNVSGNTGWIFGGPPLPPKPKPKPSKQTNSLNTLGRWGMDAGRRARKRFAMPPTVTQSASLISASDSLLPKTAEVSTIVAVLSRSDSLLPKLTEVAAILSALSRADGLAPTVAEAAAVVAVLSRSDSVLPKLADVSAVLAALSRADSLLPKTSEVSAVIAALGRSDSLLPMTSEATSGIVAAVSRADSLLITLTDAATLVAALSRSDGIAPTLAEAAAVVAVLSRSDQISPTLADVAAALAILVGSDSLSPKTAESVAGLIVALTRTDDVTVALADVAGVIGAISRSDDLGISIADVAAIVAALSRADAITLAPAEVAALVVSIGRGDSVTLALDDASHLSSVLAVADSLKLVTSDVASALAVILSRSDVLTVRLDEAVVLAVLVARAETFGISVDQIAAIVASLGRVDDVTVDIDEDARAALLLSALDGLAIDLLDETALRRILATLVIGGVVSRAAIEGTVSAFSSLRAGKPASMGVVGADLVRRPAIDGKPGGGPAIGGTASGNKYPN